MVTVDLNADLGESFGHWSLGDDEALLDVITSANVACGFHAGDPVTIERTVRAAVDRGVQVGAQVSYPDLVGFGRRRMDLSAEELAADVVYQVGAVHAFCHTHGIAVAYVKPHGALYNRIVDDELQAAAVVDALEQLGGLPLMTLAGSVAAELAAARGIRVVAEAFADRAYTDDGRLVARSEPGAVLHDAEVITARVVEMATQATVTSASGRSLPISVESVCVHGDTPGAVTIATAVRRALAAAGVEVSAWQ